MICSTRFSRRRRHVVVGGRHLIDLFPEPRGVIVSNADDARRLHGWLRSAAGRYGFEIGQLVMWPHRVLLTTRPSHERTHELGLGHTKRMHTGWLRWGQSGGGPFSGRYLGCPVHDLFARTVRRFVVHHGSPRGRTAAPLLVHGTDLDVPPPDAEDAGAIQRHLVRGWPLGPPEFVADVVSLTMSGLTTGDARTDGATKDAPAPQGRRV